MIKNIKNHEIVSSIYRKCPTTYIFNFLSNAVDKGVYFCLKLILKYLIFKINASLDSLFEK